MPCRSPAQVLPCAAIGIVRTEERVQKPLVWTKFNTKGKQKRGQTKRKTVITEGSAKHYFQSSDIQTSPLESKKFGIPTSPSNTLIRENAHRPTSLRELLCSLDTKPKVANIKTSTASRPVINDTDDTDGVPDLQYTEYLWDIADVSSGINNSNNLDESSHARVSNLDPYMRDNLLEIPHISTETDSQSPEINEEKSLLLQRLQEVEKEIENKQKKLKELRMNRELSNEKEENTKSYSDRMSDKDNDIVAMTILRMKKEPGLEDNSEDLQPLDLSKSSCLQAEEIKTSGFRNDESEISDFQKNKIPVSSPVNNVVATFTKTKELATAVGLNLKIDTTETIKKEVDSDPPTPTLDEPQEDYWSWENALLPLNPIKDTDHNSQTVTTSNSSDHHIPVLSSMTIPQTVSDKTDNVFTNAAKATDNINRIHESGNTTKVVTDKISSENQRQQELTLKKATSFFEKYIEKKQALGQKFKQIQTKTAISSIDVAQDFLPLCTTIKQEIDLEKPVMPKEIPFHPQIVSVRSLAINETKKERSTERDPRKRAQQTDSSSDNDENLQRVDPRLQRQIGRENRDTDIDTVKDISGQRCEKNKLQEDRKMKTNSFSVEQKSPIQSDSILVTKRMSNSDSNNTYNGIKVESTDMLTCNQDNDGLDTSTATKLNSALIGTTVQTESFEEGSEESKVPDELSIPDNLPTDVAKTLQDLGTAIDKIKKQFEESDETSGNSILERGYMNHQKEESDSDMSLSFDKDKKSIQNISKIVTSRPSESSEAVDENSSEDVEEKVSEERIDTIIDKSTAEMFLSTSKLCDENSSNEEHETKEMHMNSFKDLVQKQYAVLRQSAKQTSESEDSDSSTSSIENRDISKTSEVDTDFMPRNMGFSSYLPEAKNNEDGNNITQTSELLLQDVSSIKSEPNVETSYDMEHVKQEPDAGSSEQHFIEKLKVTKVISKKQTWKLRKNIKRNLIQIRQMSSTAEYQDKRPRISKFRRNLRKRRLSRSRSKSRERAVRKHRNRSKRSQSDSSRCSSPKRIRITDTRLRDVSPIRDPNFIPFHEKGKILTQYFRDKRRMRRFEGFKSFAQNRYRNETVRKAKMTLARNLVTKPFCPNTVVGRRVLLPTPNIKPIPIETFQTRSYEQPDENDSRSTERERSLSRSQGNQSDYENNNRRPREINRDKLIFDRFGNEIKLNLSHRAPKRFNRCNSSDRNVELNRFTRHSIDRSVESDRFTRRRSNDRSIETERFMNRGNSERMGESERFAKRKSIDRISESDRFTNCGNTARHDRRDRITRRRSSEDRMRPDFKRRPRLTTPSPDRAKPEKKEDEVDNTLSKAMTTLLKRILFDGQGNDNSAEGKMADMVFEMVKRKVTSNTPTDNPSTSTQSRSKYNSKSAASVSRQNDQDFESDSYWKQKNDSYFKRRSTGGDDLDSTFSDDSNERRYRKKSRDGSDDKYVYKSNDSLTRDTPRWNRDSDQFNKSTKSYGARDNNSYSPARGKYNRSYSPSNRFQSEGKTWNERKSFHGGSFYGRGRPFKSNRGGFQPNYFKSDYNSYKNETMTRPWSYKSFRGRGTYKTNRTFTSERDHRNDKEDSHRKERKTDD